MLLDNGQLSAASKNLLDPKRPKTLTTQDQEEGLIISKPVLDIDAKNTLTYGLHLLGLDKVVSTGTNLESTSLIFAYGTDMFFTERAPSGSFDVLSQDFSYSSLLITMIGLSIAIVVARYKVDN